MAIYTVKAGCCGSEAQDWAQMLLAMYARWAGRNGYDFLSKVNSGTSAGIDDAVFMVGCPHEVLAGEVGVHRLIRISPFDPKGRRHTSFAEIGNGHHSPEGGGNSIRSYILAPYHFVKDARTKHELKYVHAVLDGQIEPLLEAWTKFTGKATN